MAALSIIWVCTANRVEKGVPKGGVWDTCIELLRQEGSGGCLDAHKYLRSNLECRYRCDPVLRTVRRVRRAKACEKEVRQMKRLQTELKCTLGK